VLNLAIAVEAIHYKGHIIGDFNESNILVNQQALVTLVDTDSFQITDQNGHVHRCPVGKPEFTAPEAHGVDFTQIDRTRQHDLFSLTVMAFSLLMEGFHPFAGVMRSQMSVGRVDLYCIKQGIFPYYKASGVKPPPNAPAFNILHPELQRAFVRGFVQGFKKPAQRPSAGEWRQTLEHTENALKDCPVNANHVYSDHLKRCPWCVMQAPPPKIGRQKPLRPSPTVSPAPPISPPRLTTLSKRFSVMGLLKWTAACAVGWTLGQIMLDFFKNSIVAWTVLGLAGGCVQWAALRRYMRYSFLWIPASALQWLLFGVAGKHIFSFLKQTGLPKALFGMINTVDVLGWSALGLAGGIAQWLILTSQFRNAAIWLAASAFANGTAIVINSTVLDTLWSSSLHYLGSYADLNMYPVLYRAVFGTVYGLITGVAFWSLLNKPKP